MGKYDDIINMNRPISNRVPMSRADRAKIFLSFAALKGYDDTILEKQKIVEERMILTEDKKKDIDDKLQSLKDECNNMEYIYLSVKYFQIDCVASEEEEREVGNYIFIEGLLRKIDEYKGVIQIDDLKIKMTDIYEISVKERCK